MPGTKYVGDFFAPRPQRPSVQPTGASTNINTCKEGTSTVTPSKSIAGELQDVLTERLSKLGDYTNLTAKCAAPIAIALVADYILGTFEYRRTKKTGEKASESAAKAMQAYHRFFPPGTCTFTIPPMENHFNLSPHYHSIVGMTICHVDWEMSHPHIPLCCPFCKNGTLLHQRINLKKNKTMFPTWKHNGTITWTSCMSYKCKSYERSVQGNEGYLLITLPAYV